MKQKYSHYLPDAVALVTTLAICILLSSFLLQGQTLNTGYQDWIYHVFRAESLRINGFTSWDHIWNNGLSYWRAYQPIGSFIVACIATLLHCSVARASVLFTVFLYVFFRANIYIASRLFGANAFVAANIALASLAFTGYWDLLKDFSVAFAAALLPLFLALWWKSFENPRLHRYIAFSVGLSLYLHPIVAIINAALWLATFVKRSSQRTIMQFVQEAAIILLLSFYYLYTLFFIDSSYTTPYQFSEDFIKIIGTTSRSINPLFFVFLATSLIGVAILGTRIKRPFKILTVAACIILAVITLGMAFPGSFVLARIQIVRAGFYWVIISLLLGSVLLTLLYARWRPIVIALCIIGSVAIVTNAALMSSVYAPVPVPTIDDPVSTYFSGKPTPIGSIYITDSLISSYNLPTYRFYNGYNDHLLPNSSTLRLRELLSISPDTAVTTAQLDSIVFHMKAYGVGYLFLEPENPTVAALVTSRGFKNTGCITSVSSPKCVLIPPWSVRLAGNLNKPLEAVSLQDADQVASQIASVLYASDTQAVVVHYPTADQLTLVIPASASVPLNLYITESYSRLWKSRMGTTVKSAPNNMLLVTGTAGTATLTLQHTWGNTLFLQLACTLLAILLLFLPVKNNRTS